MQKLLHTFLLLAFLSTGVSLTSCLSDNDEETVHYSDCSITAFSLGTLNKYTKTVSSKTGNDTIVKATLTGSQYKFSINQQTHEIYNVDSLPVGVDTLHVLCNITAMNGGYVHIKSAQSDSLFNYNSTDSISFQKNPRTFVVTSNDGKYRTSYTVKLNVHKEEAAKMTWNAPYTEPAFANVDNLQTTEWNGNALVKTVKDGNVTLYTSALANGKSWATITPDTKLSATAKIAAFGNALYTSDESGNICSSTDGEHWLPVGSLVGKVLGISNGKIYFLAGNELNACSIATAETTAEQFFGVAAYPFTADANTSLCEVKKNKKITGTSIVGATEGGNATIFKAENTAEAQKWMFITNESGQDLPNAYTEIVPYGEFLLALANGKFYTSLDYGRSWQQRYYVYPPSSVPAEGNSHLFADSRGILWIIAPNGQVYTGKLNGIAWER